MLWKIPRTLASQSILEKVLAIFPRAYILQSVQESNRLLRDHCRTLLKAAAADTVQLLDSERNMTAWLVGGGSFPRKLWELLLQALAVSRPSVIQSIFVHSIGAPSSESYNMTAASRSHELRSSTDSKMKQTRRVARRQNRPRTEVHKQTPIGNTHRMIQSSSEKQQRRTFRMTLFGFIEESFPIAFEMSFVKQTTVASFFRLLSFG